MPPFTIAACYWERVDKRNWDIVRPIRIYIHGNPSALLKVFTAISNVMFLFDFFTEIKVSDRLLPIEFLAPNHECGHKQSWPQIMHLKAYELWWLQHLVVEQSWWTLLSAFIILKGRKINAKLIKENCSRLQNIQQLEQDGKHA